jgi:predicted transposase
MNLTLQIQLLPEPDQARKLRATVERFNEAANWLAGEAFDRKTANKILLQKLCYAELRERFGLSSQMAVRCIAQVCEAYDSLTPWGQTDLEFIILGLSGSDLVISYYGGRVDVEAS